MKFILSAYRKSVKRRVKKWIKLALNYKRDLEELNLIYEELERKNYALMEVLQFTRESNIRNREDNRGVYLERDQAKIAAATYYSAWQSAVRAESKKQK